RVHEKFLQISLRKDMHWDDYSWFDVLPRIDHLLLVQRPGFVYRDHYHLDRAELGLIGRRQIWCRWPRCARRRSAAPKTASMAASRIMVVDLSIAGRRCLTVILNGDSDEGCSRAVSRAGADDRSAFYIRSGTAGLLSAKLQRYQDARPHPGGGLPADGRPR